jgi:membrane associated rhomboid family serine protease
MGNLLHLLLNAYSLFIIGLTMEPALGHFRFLGYYLLFGVSGSIASLFGYDFKVSVGASGAIVLHIITSL